MGFVYPTHRRNRAPAYRYYINDEAHSSTVRSGVKVGKHLTRVNRVFLKSLGFQVLQ